MPSFTYSLEQIMEAIDWLKKQIDSQRILLLHGEMGSGKTTLTAAFIRSLGSDDHVGSPSYSIVNQYRTSDLSFPEIFHMDLYRLKTSEEVEALPILDYLESGDLCIIEWPELARPFIDMAHLEVHLLTLEDNQRKLVIL